MNESFQKSPQAILTEEVVISFGSNVGNRELFIFSALKRLHGLVRKFRCSSLYESEPMYEIDQSAFINGVVCCTTQLEPAELLLELKNIEKEVGRIARFQNGPREIDLDIVLIGERKNDDVPRLPHPRAHERRFVLEPLAEICPHFVWPDGSLINDMLHRPEILSQKITKVCDAPL